MSAIILDGKSTSAAIKIKMAAEVNSFLEKGLRKPKLVAILVGNDGASETYVASKAKDCQELGMGSEIIRFDDQVSEDTLLQKIQEINSDTNIDGLIVQLPLPKHISAEKITLAISPDKDVDGFHPVNVGNMFKGLPAFLPATPYGILLMLEQYNIKTSGKHCVIIGRSDIVGKPMSALMSRNAEPGNCTVTLCHSRTHNLSYFTQQADILIAALGKPLFIDQSMVKPGAVVIDVGITRMDAPELAKKYKIVGDVDFESVKDVASYITPVPGGVGLMTRIGLLKNTLDSYKRTFNL